MLHIESDSLMLSPEGGRVTRLDGRCEIGSRALSLSILSPLDADLKDEVPVLFPGVAAGRDINEELALEMAGDGYQTVFVGHKGGGPEASHEVYALWRGFLEGRFDEHVGGRIVPVGHSLGGGRVIRAAAHLYHEGADVADLGAVLHAPACFDGVDAKSAPASLAEELAYIARRHSWTHAARAGRSAVRYALGTGPVGLVRELRYATVHQEIDRTAALVEAGVHISAVLHDHDRLIDTMLSEQGLRRAGITDIFHVELPVDAPEGGKVLHSAQYSEAPAVKTALGLAVEAIRPTHHQSLAS